MSTPSAPGPSGSHPSRRIEVSGLKHEGPAASRVIEDVKDMLLAATRASGEVVSELDTRGHARLACGQW